MQSTVGVEVAGGEWAFINASPDFPFRSEDLLGLAIAKKRGKRAGAVFLTNADLDHVLGLLAMREAGGLAVYSTAVVRETLEEYLRLESVLGAFCNVEWKEIGDERISLGDSLFVRAIFLGGDPPPYAKTGVRDPGQSVAYEITHDERRLAIAPDVAEITSEMAGLFQDADAVLFDGTFWSDDELGRLKPGARTARQMGHVPVSESIDFLRTLKAARKSYFHINNTNPILDPKSPERAAVIAAGISIEEDGGEWIL